MATHRSKAKRKARVWQAATVLLAAGAGALFVLPLAGALQPAAASWDGLGVRPAALNDAAAQGSVLTLADATSIGDILASLSPKTEVVTPPEPDGGEGPIDEDEAGIDRPVVPEGPAPAAAGPRANWVYLGSAITPRASRALIRIDQAQKFVRLDSELDGIKLLEIHEDHIVIEEGAQDARTQRRIDRAPLLASSMLSPPRAGPATGAASRPGVQTPPTPPPPGGASASKAKEADALAAAMAAHGKAKSDGASNPGRSLARIAALPPELRAQTYTTLTSAAASYEDKIRAISELGFDPNAPIDERREAIRALGLDPENPELQRLLEDEMAGAARDQR